MILLNIYGKIAKTIISEKLGIGLLNPSEDWIEGFIYDMKKELLIRKHDISKYNKYNDINLRQYNPTKIVKENGWSKEKENVSMNQALRIIAQNLIGIEVIDFDNSFIKCKNPYIDSPMCEKSYAHKFICFLYNIQKSFKDNNIIINQIPFVTYSSDDLHNEPLILNYTFNKEDLKKSKNYNENCIKSIINMGNLIDNFLKTQKDFWILDYIINTLFESDEYNAYYVFKIMSLIEMLIINPKNNGITVGELEKKLPMFILDEDLTSEDKLVFSSIVRGLRNKIGHADYNAIQKLLGEYRKKIIPNYSYDEYEYSIENWNFLSISIMLNNILSNIVFLMLTNRKKLEEIQNS